MQPILCKGHEWARMAGATTVNRNHRLTLIGTDYADYYMQRLGVSLTLVALHDCRRFSGPQAVWIYADWADAVNAAGFFTTNEHEWAQMAGAVNVDSYAGVQSRYTNGETLIGFAELSCQ